MKQPLEEEKSILVAVGSREDQVCSIGAFARKEAEAFKEFGYHVEVLSPSSTNQPYPDASSVNQNPNYIFFHTPSLCERGRPWLPLNSFFKLKRSFPSAKVVSIVHEFSEAPFHWKLRQAFLASFSDKVVVNSKADFDGLKKFNRNTFRSTLGPTLVSKELQDNVFKEDVSTQIKEKSVKAKSDLLAQFAAQLKPHENKKWILYPGLVVPGKGVENLSSFAKLREKNFLLIVMGAFGPKPEDKTWGQGNISKLRSVFKDRFIFFESIDDQTFQKFLIASDLILLPFDQGVSERRSSFLAAMSNAAQVWTTTDKFSSELKLESSAAIQSTVEDWKFYSEEKVLPKVEATLALSSVDQLKNRVCNLKWSSFRSWKKRVQEISDFISS